MTSRILNNRGQVVGSFVDPAGAQHGFIGDPHMGNDCDCDDDDQGDREEDR